jgi:hypothetical protein
MSFKITVKNAAGDEAEWGYPTDVKLCTEVPPAGRNAFREVLISELEVGDMICHQPGKHGPSNEVVSVEEI